MTNLLLLFERDDQYRVEFGLDIHAMQQVEPITKNQNP